MMTRNRNEILKLVFALGEATASTEVPMGVMNVKMQRRAPSLDYVDALRLLMGRIRVLGLDPSCYENGRAIPEQSMITKIEKKGCWGHLETADFSLQYGLVGSYDHCFVSVQEKMPAIAGSWDQWVEPFIRVKGFVQGWVSDVDYDYWQNARDPEEYAAAGRDCSSLPMKSNGLPPPVDRMEIDISENPGRWVLRQGYVESVAAVMWIGELFWNRVGQDRRPYLRTADCINVSEVAPGVVKLEVEGPPFIAEDSSEIQDRVRALLYG
jgi:hypothetical protein